MIGHIESYKVTKLELITEFNTTAGYKISDKKNQMYFYTVAMNNGIRNLKNKCIIVIKNDMFRCMSKNLGSVCWKWWNTDETDWRTPAFMEKLFVD